MELNTNTANRPFKTPWSSTIEGLGEKKLLIILTIKCYQTTNWFNGYLQNILTECQSRHILPHMEPSLR